MVSKFQRTSSPGRNGYLSRLHHSSRGLSVRRLQVLTIHNFALKRTDGSTAAQRYLADNSQRYIVEHMGELPLPNCQKTCAV